MTDADTNTDTASRTLQDAAEILQAMQFSRGALHCIAHAAGDELPTNPVLVAGALMFVGDALRTMGEEAEGLITLAKQACCARPA